MKRRSFELLAYQDRLDEMNDKFEDIEHEQFGEDGFEDVKQNGAIESGLGVFDISQFTTPPPPKVFLQLSTKL